jgi:hypothetical protein
LLIVFDLIWVDFRRYAASFELVINAALAWTTFLNPVGRNFKSILIDGVLHVPGDKVTLVIASG